MFNKDAQRMRNFKDWSDDEIRSVKAPALLVAGDRDLPLAEHLAAMSRLLPDCRLAILPGNHGSYIGEIMSHGIDSRIPELFVAMINEFLVGIN